LKAGRRHKEGIRQMVQGARRKEEEKGDHSAKQDSSNKPQEFLDGIAGTRFSFNTSN
jgi:hypothetical protein